MLTRRFFCWLALAALAGGCRQSPAPPPFDVAALVGLPIGELDKRLGAPATSSAPGQKTWKRGQATLTATFKPLNGRVTELALIARAPADAVREGEQSQLLQAGHLRPDDARYSTDWIEAPERPLFYNGVRVVPAPRTYRVQLRVSGPPELLQVSYSLPGATAPTQTFLTVAPWDMTATLPDNTAIQLVARTAQAQTIASTPIIAQILVDGKVVASKKASVVASCAWEL